MLELKHVSQRYQYEKILDDISLTFPDVGFISIVGPSGCGKSTLLYVIGGLQKDFVGELCYNGKNVKKQLNKYRRQHVSFIFQQFHLIMWLSVLTNIDLSYYFHKHRRLAQKLDISEFEHLKMRALSGGQRQRIAFLRAAHDKDILLCDEPTGSLDPQHANQVMEKLAQEAKHRLVIVVSHDLQLVKKYSQEIYEMKDGHIQAHHILKTESLPVIDNAPLFKQRLPRLRLSIYSLLSHKKRTIQLIFALTISLLCILITNTLSRQLEQQIQKYLLSIVPPSSIGMQSLNHQSLSLDIAQSLSEKKEIERTQLFLDDYELLGVGFIGERYQESQTLFIGDDASPYEHLQLKYGRFPIQKEDILLSYSTAQHLCQSSAIQQIVGKKLFAWYKHENHVQAITYHVVGVTQNTTVVETLYQKENAYLSLLQDTGFLQDYQSHLGMIYIQPDLQRSQVIKLLKQDYPAFQFLESGASTSLHISQTMDQVTAVLLLFSTLAILSSLFLIGEVMFLNVIQKKKDYVIMICFGAKIRDIVGLVVLESLEILLCAWIIVMVLYAQFLYFGERVMSELLGAKLIVFAWDYRLLGIVFIGSVFLILLSQLLPIGYIMKMDSVEVLKG